MGRVVKEVDRIVGYTTYGGRSMAHREKLVSRPLLVPVLILLLAGSSVVTRSQKQETSTQVTPDTFIPIDYLYLVSAEARLYGAQGSERVGHFIVDTGSQVSQLRRSTAEALGLTVSAQMNVHTLAGDRLIQEAVLPKICFSAVCTRLLKVQLLPDSPLDSNEGILGANLFNGHVLTIDYPNRKISLTYRPPPMPGYRSILKAPMNLIDGLGFVACELPGLKECNLLIDTANTETAIFGENSGKFIHLKSVTRTSEMVSATGNTPVKFGPISWMKIAGSLQLSNITVGLVETNITSPLHATNGPGLLGNEIMQNYVVQLRYADKTLYFLQKK